MEAVRFFYGSQVQTPVLRAIGLSYGLETTNSLQDAVFQPQPLHQAPIGPCPLIQLYVSYWPIVWPSESYWPPLALYALLASLISSV